MEPIDENGRRGNERKRNRNRRVSKLSGMAREYTIDSYSSLWLSQAVDQKFEVVG